MRRFHHKYTLPLIIILLILAIVALFFGWKNFMQETTLPTNSNTSAIGVELDQRFDYIDLHKLQENGVSFIYLRSTQGKSYFDDNYLSYRDQVKGTNLAFGTVVYFSNQSNVQDQLAYFKKQVGFDTGSLPIMVVSAISDERKSYLKSMASFVSSLQQENKKVIVALDYKYHGYFPKETQFLATGNQQPNSIKYSFWRYTEDGRVKNIDGLKDNVTMFSYNGSVAQYRQKYGQLTQ